MEGLNVYNQDLYDHGGDAHYVREFCCYMSPAFIHLAGDCFVNVSVTFKIFHAMKVTNEAMEGFFILLIEYYEAKWQGLNIFASRG